MKLLAAMNSTGANLGTTVLLGLLIAIVMWVLIILVGGRKK
jgi:H+/gluconate symporter-like permease